MRTHTSKLAKILACPDCKSAIKLEGRIFYCSYCRQKFPLKEEMPILISHFSSDVEITKNQWDKNYKKWWSKSKIFDYLKEYRQDYLDDTLIQMEKFWQIKPGLIYCELGCGPAIVGLEMAKRGCQVVGIDLSVEGLKLAKKLYAREHANGLFVCGDILNMPFRAESLDLIYAGGVLEHFKNTHAAVEELYRVTKKGGRIFATVPFVSLSTLTYRQLYGNIPELPILKTILEFIHTDILKRRFMPFGYEKSFTEGRLKQLFLTAGFRQVRIGFFDCHLPFYRFKSERLKNVLRRLAKLKLFWPMVYVEAIKS